MIKFSILINTHNQNEYIFNSIDSCLKQTYKNYEIIITDTSKKKINLNKFLNNKKKIKYFHIQSQNKIAEMNQMNKIIKGFEQSTGDYIILLDGDDYFHENKLSELSKIIEKKRIICNQDLPIFLRKNQKIKMKKKIFKKKFFVKYFLNKWPQIYGTSSIVIKKDFLNNFFRNSNYLNWKYLAIDAQLILFCHKHKVQSNYLEGFTFKRLHDNNLGESYMNIFKKKFWSRRYMQFQYWEFLGNKNFNLDYLFTKLIYFTTKYL